MEEKDFMTDLRAQFPETVRDASRLPGDDVLLIDRGGLLDMARALRHPPWDFEILLDLTCVDFTASRGVLEMVYTFLSLKHNRRLRVKTEVPVSEPRLASLTPLWKNADWLEREVFDLFGVRFDGHPDLKRLFLYEGFEGHPLRKDYPLRRRQPLIPLKEKT